MANTAAKVSRKISQTALNTRERKFVDLYIQSYLSSARVTNTALAIRAGYSPNCAHVTAARALKRDKIKQAIDDGLSKAGENSSVSEAIILRELRRIALGDKTPVSARLKALELLGKTLTMFSERTVVVPEVPNLSPDEITRYRRISAALDRPALAASNIPDDVLDGEVIDDDDPPSIQLPDKPTDYATTSGLTGMLDDEQTDDDSLVGNTVDSLVAGEQSTNGTDEDSDND